MTMTVDDFFEHWSNSRVIFNALHPFLLGLDPVEERVSKSEIAYRRKKSFAWVWIPEQYLKRAEAPLVLTVALHRSDPSPRWKQVVEPYPGRFTHHLELYFIDEIDDEVRTWLREAWSLVA